MQQGPLCSSQQSHVMIATIVATKQPSEGMAAHFAASAQSNHAAVCSGVNPFSGLAALIALRGAPGSVAGAAGGGPSSVTYTQHVWSTCSTSARCHARQNVSDALHPVFSKFYRGPITSCSLV